jgi:hypothetical protein
MRPSLSNPDEKNALPAVFVALVRHWQCADRIVVLTGASGMALVAAWRIVRPCSSFSKILEKELTLRLKYTQLPLAPQRSEILRGGQFESGIDAGLETADNQAQRNFENNCPGP